jgi:hypothetical protein
MERKREKGKQKSLGREGIMVFVGMTMSGKLKTSSLVVVCGISRLVGTRGKARHWILFCVGRDV